MFQIGIISVSNGGSISLEKACFLGNSGSNGISPSGTIVIDGNSVLALNDENYGRDNTVDGSCRDIFFSSSGECEFFSGQECIEMTTIMPTTIDTLSPTLPPLALFTSLPSTNPTFKSTMQKTLPPTSSPVESTPSPAQATSSPSNTTTAPSAKPSKYTLQTPTFIPIDRTTFPSNDFISMMPIYFLPAHPTTIPTMLGSSKSSKRGKLFKSYSTSKAGKSSHKSSYLASEVSRKSVKSGKINPSKISSHPVPSTPSFLLSSASRKSVKSGKLLSSLNLSKVHGDLTYLASNASRKSDKSGKFLSSSKSRKSVASKSGKILFKSKASTTKGVTSRESEFI